MRLTLPVKAFLIAFALTFFLTSVTIVFAKDATISARPLPLKERIQANFQLFKEKIATFKDKRKAQTVERINEQLNKINERKTTQMAHHLEQMDKLVIKIEARVASASAAGKDTSSIQSALNEAKGDIATAKSAVMVQAANDYTITVTSEATAGAEAKAMREKLHSDLKATHTLIVEARKSLAFAVSTAVSTIKGKRP